jgi:Fe-Mn family superoxide dismutase
MRVIYIFLIGLSSIIGYSQEFTLPKLNFNFSDLEPYIDSSTMRIHYSKHHQGYVNNLNKALGSENKLGLNEIFKNVSNMSSAVRNNAGGHFNHTLFWEILSPDAEKNVTKPLENQIIKQFGSLDSLKNLITQTGVSLFGSGWVWLIVTKSKELKVVITSNQDNPLMDISFDKGIPILAIDVWEHAYYLKYQNKRVDYLKNIWNVIDWKVISNKFEQALENHE